MNIIEKLKEVLNAASSFVTKYEELKVENENLRTENEVLKTNIEDAEKIGDQILKLLSE